MTDPSKLTDADIEHLRRAMVEAHQTAAALYSAYQANREPDTLSESEAAQSHAEETARAYVAAKRARGGL